MTFIFKIFLHIIAVTILLSGLFPQNSTICIKGDGGIEIEYRCDCKSESTSCCQADELAYDDSNSCLKDHCRDTQIIKFNQIQPTKSVAPIKVLSTQFLFWDYFSAHLKKEKVSLEPLVHSVEDVHLPPKISLLLLENTVLII